MERAGSILALTLAALWGCGEPDRVGEVTVFAAASATSFLPALVSAYEADQPVQVRTSFAASGLLARQVADGAPADVFLSANRRWMNWLQRNGELIREPVVVAHNSLVCIRHESDRVDPSATSLAGFAEALGDGARIGIADASVPAGEYVREALARSGQADGLARHLVGFADVRAVLAAVVAGQLDAGFVYATDAHSSDEVRVLFEFDASSHAPVELLAAVIRETSEPEAAARFVDYLTSMEARSVLSEAGFVLH